MQTWPRGLGVLSGVADDHKIQLVHWTCFTLSIAELLTRSHRISVSWTNSNKLSYAVPSTQPGTCSEGGLFRAWEAPVEHLVEQDTADAFQLQVSDGGWSYLIDGLKLSNLLCEDPYKPQWVVSPKTAFDFCIFIFVVVQVQLSPFYPHHFPTPVELMFLSMTHTH